MHYRGGGPALQDLLGGPVDLMTNRAAVFLPQARAGGIRVYAVLAKERLPQAPEIPTADEAGLPGFQMSVWNGLWAPKGTPADMNALAEPQLRLRLLDLAYEMPPREKGTPQALRALQRAGIAKWWPIISEGRVTRRARKVIVVRR